MARISVLTPSFSQNCLGRAYILAKALMPEHTVDVIGPIYPRGMWEPLADEAFPYTTLPTKMGLRSLLTLRPMVDLLKADVVIVSKPLYPNLLAGIWHKRRTGCRLIVDIDDNEADGFAAFPIHRKIQSHLHFSQPHTYPPLVRFTFSLIHKADAITVSSTYLQHKFGGTIIPHGRDTTLLDPALYQPAEAKRRLGLGSEPVVMFLGTPRPHKGLEELIAAMQKYQANKARLVLVGFPKANHYVQKLMSLADEQTTFLSHQPFSELPQVIAAADVMVIPQQASTFSQGQVPAKVFDAMAMAKPIVSTTISDLPEILADKSGLLVEPGNVDALGQAITYLLEHPAEAKQMGQNARQRCIERYSLQAMKTLLTPIVQPPTNKGNSYTSNNPSAN